MESVIQSKLYIHAELRNVMICEACGVTAPKRPWADGWVGNGRSRRAIFRDTIDPTVGAHWCPAHVRGYAKGENPSIRELRDLRERLLEAERSAEQPKSEPQIEQAAIPDPVLEAAEETPVIKWSARREGLVPMVTN